MARWHVYRYPLQSAWKINDKFTPAVSTGWARHDTSDGALPLGRRDWTTTSFGSTCAITARATDTDGHVRFVEGDAVELEGLRGAPQHNGKRAVIKRHDLARQEPRYIVELRGPGAGTPEQLAIKPANLRAVVPLPTMAPAVPLTRAEAAGCDSGLFFEEGDTVRLDGLKAAARLNGQTAIVVEWDASGGRYLVAMTRAVCHS